MHAAGRARAPHLQRGLVAGAPVDDGAELAVCVHALERLGQQRQLASLAERRHRLRVVEDVLNSVLALAVASMQGAQRM